MTSSVPKLKKFKGTTLESVTREDWGVLEEEEEKEKEKKKDKKTKCKNYGRPHGWGRWEQRSRQTDW